jgi:hypothetical protein
VKFGPPPAGHGYGAPELASAGADAAAAPDAANVTVSTAAAAPQDRTILGVFVIFVIFAITELPPTPRRVVKPDQTFPDKSEHW